MTRPYPPASAQTRGSVEHVRASDPPLRARSVSHRISGDLWRFSAFVKHAALSACIKIKYRLPQGFLRPQPDPPWNVGSSVSLLQVKKQIISTELRESCLVKTTVLWGEPLPWQHSANLGTNERGWFLSSLRHRVSAIPGSPGCIPLLLLSADNEEGLEKWGDLNAFLNPWSWQGFLPNKCDVGEVPGKVSRLGM